MTRTKTMPTFERQLIGLAVAACCAGAVHANPTGPTVVNGSASFATSGSALTVTNTPGAIINWQQFSIRPDEVTRFIQSGAASAVLNRVTGPQASAILGQLLSNGRVFLINPNGVVIGAGARIDTAGFVASSLNLSNEDFLAGRFRFTDPGNAGKVTNAGTIDAHTGGPVYLIAPTVENHGVITAPNGDILLAAGKSVELVSAGNPSLRVQVQAGGEAVNIGQLLAASGRVGLYGAALRNAGTVSADSASVNAAGNVVLKASRDVTLETTSVVSANGAQGGAVHVQAEGGTLLADGRIEAKGAVDKGGDVKLLGAQVGLVGDASVDASGAGGGGTVNVGGSRQGAGPLPNSRAIFVGADARIDASATVNGDGGTVIAYADDAARIHGHLSARGGPQGGDGGFIETSGRQYLDVLRTPDATAPAGRGGEWLIDPNNILIVTAAGTCTNLSGCAAGPNWATTNDSAQLGVNLINNALNAGTNVTVTTTASGANTQPGNITFQAGANVSKTTVGSAPATLTLQAHNDINTTGATISAANNVNVGQLSVVLTADSDSSGAGNVVVGGAVTTRGGSFTASGAGISGAGAINTSGIAGRTGGNISLTGQPTGSVNVTGAMTASGGAAAAGSAGNAGGTVSLSGGTVTVGAVTALGSNGAAGGFAGGTGGTVNVTKTGAAATAATLNGLIDVRGGNSTNSATGGTGGTVTVDAGAGSVATTGASLGTLINASGGRGQNGGTVALNATGNINIAAAGNKAILTSGGTAATNTAGRNAGNITIASTGGTVTARVLTATGSAGVGAGANAGGSGGAISVSGVGATLNGAVSATGGNSVNAGAGGSGGTVTVTGTTGTVSSVAAGTINVSGGRGQDAGTVTVSSGGTGTVNLAGTITASGGAAETGSAGQNGGNVNVSGGTIAVRAVTARGSNGAGVGFAGGSGGTVNVTKTGAAATAVTLNGLIDVRGGDSTNSATGGTGGTVTVDAGAGSVATTGANLGTLINASGGRGQNGGAVAINATGNVNIAAAGNKAILTSGGTAATNTAGRNAGNITIASTGGTVTARVLTAAGSAGNGGSNVGGSGGAISVSGVGATLNGAVSAVGGNSVGTGVGGSGGSVTVNGASGAVTVASTITTTGGRGQDAGAVSITTTGAVAVNNTITASGGTAATSASGRAGGAVTITGGSVATRAITVSGSNAVSANQGGGNAGTINLTSTGGGITVNAGAALTARAGAATGTGAGGAAGSIALSVTGGNIAANAITTQGNNKTDGGAVTLAATGTATAGAITTSGGAGINSAGRSGGAVSVTGADVTVGAVTTSGGAGAGTNQAGGNAGVILLDATDGSPTVTVNGNLTAAGGARTGTGVAGSGANITLDGNALLTGNRTISSAGAAGGGAGGATTLGGTVNSSGAARSLTVNTGTGAVAFGGALGNTLALGALSVTANGIALPATNAASMTLASTGGNITQTGPAVVTGATAITGGAGAVTLTNAGNNFNSVSVASGASASIFDSNALTAGPVTATGDVLIQTAAGIGNDLTLAGNVTSTTGNVTLASGEDIHYGAFGPVAAAGRWLTYSRNPANNTGTIPVPGGAKPNIYNCSFGGPCGATVPATGNHNVYSFQPLLTYTANAANRPYGDPNPAFSGTVSGLLPGDIAADAYNGTLAFTSPAIGTTPVGGAAINGSGLSSDIGYGFVQAAGNATALTITPRPITLTAGAAGRLYGDPNPVPAPPYTVGGSGMANLEDAQALFGFTVASGALGTTPVGVYAVGPNAYNIAGVGVGVSGNYSVTAINPGTLTITPAPLTITANDAARAVAQPNPPFSAAYAGFKNAETPAALGGALVFTTPATIASSPGAYAITPSGQTATNYTITYVDGVLTVTPTPVVPVPPAPGGVAAADNAFITAAQRSVDAESEVAPRAPDAQGVDCLELERGDVRRVLTRCF
jgi:filamentous hemagglutinin family protein